MRCSKRGSSQCKREARLGFKLCEECAAHSRENMAKRQANGKSRAMKAGFKARGLCSGCGCRKPEPGYVRCDHCYDVQTASRQKNRARYLFIQQQGNRRRRSDPELRKKDNARKHVYRRTLAGQATQQRTYARRIQWRIEQTIRRDFGLEEE